ncbi:MAG: serine/threonine-protein phosphatase [Streptomycetaceae bacterium]|nr:serine/threonine-protein phosphatase [Streptomycetaceae bacterium]
MDQRSTARTGALLATAWLLALTLVDASLPPGTIAPDVLFPIAPLMACAVLPARPTTAFGVAAVVLTVWSGWWNDAWGDAQQYVRLLEVALVSTAATTIAVVRVRRERHLARVEKIAEAAQHAILPRLPRSTTGVAVAARYVSAAQDAVVGGDLYDVCLAGGHTRFVVGDVRGKGLTAVEHAARVIRAFRQAAPVQGDLAEVAGDMDAYLVPFLGDEDFVTALLVDITDPARIHLTSCGHPPAVLIRSDGTAQHVDAPVGLPLGLGGGFATATATWEPGDRLLLYTDGLSEARDRNGTFLPLLDVAPALATGTPDEALDRLLEAVRRHVPQQQLGDDLAVVVLERLGADVPVRRAGSSAGFMALLGTSDSPTA